VAKRKTKNVGGFILVVGLLPVLNTFPTVFSFWPCQSHLIKMRFILCIPFDLCSNFSCCRVPSSLMTTTVFKDKCIVTMTIIIIIILNFRAGSAATLASGPFQQSAAFVSKQRGVSKRPPFRVEVAFGLFRDESH
jgi:hypothetical protein